MHQHGDYWTYYFYNGEEEELDADIEMNLVNLEILTGGDKSFNVTLKTGMHEHKIFKTKTTTKGEESYITTKKSFIPLVD